MGAVPAGRILEWVGWVLLLCFLVGIHNNQPNDYGHSITFGLVSVIFGVRGFIGNGGAQVTAVGLFQFSSALFVGFAGAYAGIEQDARVTAAYLGTAILAGIALQLLVTIFAGAGKPSSLTAFPETSEVNRLAGWGGGILLVLMAADVLGFTKQYITLTEGAAFTSTTMIAVGLLWRENARLMSASSLIIAASFLAYAEVFHSGQGRLRIVALACVLAILFTIRFQRVLLKWLVVVAAPVALFWLAQQRLSLQETLAAGASAGRTGLESMTVPIVIFGQLLDAQAEGFPKSWGYNLLSTLSPLFRGGPEALGYELVLIHSPAQYGTGFSVAATAAGEAVYNFGLLGILIAAPVLAMFLKLVDNLIRKNVELSHLGRVRLLTLVVLAMVGGAVADLVWCGQHIFIMRTLTRLPILALVVLAWMPGRFINKRPKPVRRILRVQNAR
ncbi:hypothetical protein NtRootA9_28910 [Arthrobacter sp. NtRootA9]|nr:hypothetical protein NtRootA9_28910 [Arthrobacter sp. NtRootA9]